MIETLYESFRHWSEYGSVYIMSDTHFADSDCKLMDENWISPEEQVKRINNIVHNCDTLILLGDVGDTKYVQQLNGYKVLITGNHDKSADTYKLKTRIARYLVSEWTKEEVLQHLREKMPYHTFYIKQEPFDNQLYFKCTIVNNMFNEVYDGPLFIADKLLLSHEPIELPFAVNIHGHDHAGQFRTINQFGCNEINVAANVCGYTPINLGQEIKRGLLSKTSSIHRITIDDATARKAVREAKRQSFEDGR